MTDHVDDVGEKQMALYEVSVRSVGLPLSLDHVAYSCMFQGS